MAALARSIFLCTNQRPEPRPSCGVRGDAARIARHLEERLSRSGPLPGGQSIAVTRTRCLGRCQQGPVLAIFPENVWYTYGGEHDVDEIVSEHIVRGRPVERLLLEARPLSF